MSYWKAGALRSAAIRQVKVCGYGASPRRRSWLNAAIERLVALAHLLPLAPAIAFDDLRHQLLGGDLFDVLFAVAREVAISRWKRNPFRHILIGRPVGRSCRSRRYNSSLAMPELTGHTRAPRFSFAPIGPTSTGDAEPVNGGVRESPSITSASPPCRRANLVMKSREPSGSLCTGNAVTRMNR